MLILSVLLCNGQKPESEPKYLIGQFSTLKNEKARMQLLDTFKLSIQGIENQLAKKYWHQLILISEKKDYKNELGNCLYSLSILQRNDGEYIECYNALQRCLKIFTTTGYKRGLAITFNGLGNLHNSLQNNVKSVEYFKKSYELFNDLGENIPGAQACLNLGSTLILVDSLSLSKNYLNRAARIFKKEKDYSNLIFTYLNLGEVYEKTAQNDSSYYYFKNSILLSTTLMDSLLSFWHLGKLLLNIGRTNEAKDYLVTAYNLAAQTEKAKIFPDDYMDELTNALYRYYTRAGDTINAYIFLKKTTDLAIEKNRHESNKAIDLLTIRNLEESTERERAGRIRTLYISLTVFFFSIVLLLTLYRNYLINKRANRLLTEMDELKTRLYSNITHELRTPLTLILGPLEQMLSSESDKTASRKQVKMMQKNAKSLLKMVNQMLDLSKLDAHSLHLQLTETDIVKFIRTRFATFSSLAENKKIHFNIDISVTKHVDFIDKPKLEKIINNLVSNAIKFTPAGGFINCRASINTVKNSYLIISVEDSGKGIPENEIHWIFDRFHQVENEEAYQKIGTGIGLSLTKELVELMHGEIGVISKPGKGTRFTVQLPLGKNHLDEHEYIVSSAKSKTDLIVKQVSEYTEETETTDGKYLAENPKTENKEEFPQVLIVDDQPEMREFITENLADCCDIIQSGDGAEAFKLAARNIPDLVVTDLMMPKIDGTQLCRKLKTDERTSHIPVIILTGRTKIKDRLQGLETGADAYLTKPFSIKELRLRIHKLIEQRKKLREKFTTNLDLHPADIAVTSADERFIKKAMEVIEKNMSNSQFEVRQFQNEMLMSRMQLFRKIKALTNQTPSEFIRTIRLKRAAHLLEQNYGNIAQITYEVGFNNPSYFAKCFRELFGKLPSEFAKSGSGQSV